MPDREKVIGDLEGLTWGDWHEWHSDSEVRTIAKDAIALLKEQNWISVRDRLPNCNGCYLVWRPHFYPDKGMPSICYFDGQNTWHDSYGVDFTRTLAPDDVSHWMPLPEQPCK